MILNIIEVFAGLIISLLLFYRFPMLKKSTDLKRPYKVSVIIPARNEEKNIPLLLQDLNKQTYSTYEIICVDDCSEDNTANIVSSYGVSLLSIKNKPEDWTGKAWACEKGAESASGDLLLFLDADVRLQPLAISNLLSTYDENQCVISVQPYHQTEKKYEQFSLFFNLIQIAANGTSSVLKFKNPGLYGPVILINRDTYRAIEGHTSAKSSIVDDLALGEKLTQKGFPFKLYLGGKDISFRMYGGGFKKLLQGWTKNYATGAMKTPLLLFVMVFLWITSCTSVFLFILQSIGEHNLLETVIFTILYIFWVLELFRIAGRTGNFKKYVIFCFPIYMIVFLGVFIISFIKKIFHLNVVWKDRKIRLDK